jgi:hypothetical protein
MRRMEKEHIERRVTCISCPNRYCLDCHPEGCAECGSKDFYTSHTKGTDYPNTDIVSLNDVDLERDRQEGEVRPSFDGFSRVDLPVDAIDRAEARADEFRVTTTSTEERANEEVSVGDFAYTTNLSRDELNRLIDAQAARAFAGFTGVPDTGVEREMRRQRELDRIDRARRDAGHPSLADRGLRGANGESGARGIRPDQSAEF